MVSLDESENLDPKTTINLELKEGVSLAESESFKSDIARQVKEYMMIVNKDFSESVKEDKTAGQIHIECFLNGTGFFADKDTKRIKNKYLIKNSVLR